MKKLKGLLSKGQKLAKQVTELATDASKTAKDYWVENKDELQAQGKEALETGQKYASSTYESAS